MRRFPAARHVSLLLGGFATAALATLAPAQTQAQALPPGVTLGMDESALRAALPQLDKVRRPHRAPGGALAQWRLAQATAGQHVFEETFYLQAHTLQQVELVLLPQQPSDTGPETFAW